MMEDDKINDETKKILKERLELVKKGKVVSYKEMESKIKMKDFVDECVRWGITHITMDFSGLGVAVADALKNKGIEVINSRK